MKKLTLAKIYHAGFALSDIDLLVKHKKAKLVNQNGNTMVEMDTTECYAFLDQYFRRW